MRQFPVQGGATSTKNHCHVQTIFHNLRSDELRSSKKYCHAQTIFHNFCVDALLSSLKFEEWNLKEIQNKIVG